MGNIHIPFGGDYLYYPITLEKGVFVNIEKKFLDSKKDEFANYMKSELEKTECNWAIYIKYIEGKVKLSLECEWGGFNNLRIITTKSVSSMKFKENAIRMFEDDSILNYGKRFENDNIEYGEWEDGFWLETTKRPYHETEKSWQETFNKFYDGIMKYQQDLGALGFYEVKKFNNFNDINYL